MVVHRTITASVVLLELDHGTPGAVVVQGIQVEPRDRPRVARAQEVLARQPARGARIDEARQRDDEHVGRGIGEIAVQLEEVARVSHESSIAFGVVDACNAPLPEFISLDK